MRKLGRYLPMLAVAGLAAVATPACAAQTYRYGYGGPRDGVYARDIERRAYDRGFRDGLDDGRSDARHNRRF